MLIFAVSQGSQLFDQKSFLGPALEPEAEHHHRDGGSAGGVVQMTAIPTYITIIPAYIGCRTKRYGPVSMIRWPSLCVTLADQKRPRCRRAHQHQAMAVSIESSI